MFETSKLTRDEIFRYRVLLIFGVIAYPLWGLIGHFFLPEDSVMPWLWAVATLVPFCLLVASFFVKQPLRHLEISIVLTGYLLLLHSTLTIVESRVNPLRFCGYLILISTLINVFPSKRSSVFVALSTVIFCGGLLYSSAAWELNPIFVCFAVGSAVVPSLFANFTRLNQLRALQSAQAQQNVLFSALEESLIVYDPDGKIEVVNPAAQRFLGLDSNKVHQTRIDDGSMCFLNADGTLFPPELLPAIVARKTGKPVRNQVLGIEKENKEVLWANCSAIPYFFQSKKPRVVVTFADITDIKKSNELISQQQTQLFSSAKLRALGEMAAGVAHEINNPLSVITGKTSEIMRNLDRGASLESIMPHLEKISSTVWRIQKIIKGLQTFSRGGERDPFLPNSLLKMTEEIFAFCNERIQMRGITVHLEIPSTIRFDCRSVQISQVLLNLVQNASDAVRDQKMKWIRVRAELQDDRVLIWVSDSGAGIAKDIEDKIMEPFFTTKEVGEGTGLGLSISKGLIQGHNGRLELVQQSNPTTFLIELPRYQQNLPKAA